MTYSIQWNRSLLVPIIHTLLFVVTLISSEYLYGEIKFDDPNNQKFALNGGLSSDYIFSADHNRTIGTEIFFSEICKRIGRISKFQTFDSTSEILNAMREDKLDTIYANSIDYLDLESQINPKFSYAVTFGPSPEQHIYLLTPGADSIREISQLQGKRLSLPKGYPLGLTYLEVYLAKAGLPAPEAFFSTIHYTSQNAALFDIFFNRADLAITTDVAYNLASELNPQLLEKIDILAVSEPYIPYVIGINKQIPNSFIKPIDDILMRLKHESRLRKILAFFHATDVVRVRSEQLDTIRALKQEHQQLVRIR